MTAAVAGGAGGGEYSPFKTFANIFISFVGAGVLGLPYAFKIAGIVEGIVIMSLAAIICVKAMLMLVECKAVLIKMQAQERAAPAPPTTKKARIQALTSDSRLDLTAVSKDMDYGDLGQAAFGSRGWWIVQISIILSQIGFCCAYLIFITENLHNMFSTIHTNQFLVLCLMFLLPLTFIRDLRNLALFSLFAEFANVFAYAVVFFFDFKNIHSEGVSGRPVNLAGVPFFLSIAIYCYEGAGMILALESSVPKEHRKEFPRLLTLTIGMVTALYVVFGVSGYASFGEDVETIITLNLPKGFFPVVVKFCLSISLFFTYPVMMFPVSQTLEKSLAKDDTLERNRGNALRVGLVVFSGLVVTTITDFATIMGLIGSTCCMLLALIIPGIIHLRVCAAELSLSAKVMDFTIIGIGIIASFLGTRDVVMRILGYDDGTSASHV